MVILFLELAGLILLNWSISKIVKVGSILWFILFILSIVVVFITIRQLITNSKINKS